MVSGLNSNNQDLYNQKSRLGDLQDRASQDRLGSAFVADGLRVVECAVLDDLISSLTSVISEGAEETIEAASSALVAFGDDLVKKGIVVV